MEGEIEALHIGLARIALMNQGISSLKIHRKMTWFHSSNRITAHDITSLLQQLALLLQAGIPILRALFTFFSSCSKKSMRYLVQSIHLKIQEGLPLSEALSQYPNYFDHFTRQLIIAGEQTGSMEILLERLVEQREKKLALKNKIKKALYYPSFVLLCALSLVYLLFLFIIPQFSSLFAAFGSELPWLTQIVINLASHALLMGTIALLFSLSSLIACRYSYQKSARFRGLIDRWILATPFYGSFHRKNFMIQFSYLLSISASAGIPILNALYLMESLSENSIVKQRFSTLVKTIQAGYALHEALTQSQLFSPLAIQMVAIGEEAGKLEEVLQKIADWYNMELNQSVEAFNQLIEPAVMMIVGLVVGMIVIALYLPIFKLGMVI